MRPLADRGLIAPRAYRKGSHWIVYRLIEAPDDWYTDLPGWRAWVIEQLMRTWRDCADLIDQGVASLTRPGDSAPGSSSTGG